MMRTLTLCPIGGLANRMRAILSAQALSISTGMHLRIIWCKDKGLAARYNQLFLPYPSDKVTLIEADSLTKVLHEVPRKRNLWWPIVWQRIAYDVVLHEPDLLQVLDKPKRLIEKLSSARNALIVTGMGFFPTDDTLFAHNFRPLPELVQKIEERVASLKVPSVGLHIRRTDNLRAISESPLEAFISRTRSLAPAHIYAATDDESVKQSLQQAFPQCVSYSSFAASRSTLCGMQEAVIEMFTLTRTTHFLGSYYSSFSDIIIALRGNGSIIRK